MPINYSTEDFQVHEVRNIAKSLYQTLNIDQLIAGVQFEVVMRVNQSQLISHKHRQGLDARYPWTTVMRYNKENGLEFYAVLILEELEKYSEYYNSRLASISIPPSQLSIVMYALIEMFSDVKHKSELVSYGEYGLYKQVITMAHARLSQNDNLELINIFDPLHSMNNLAVATVFPEVLHSLVSKINREEKQQ